MKLFWTKSRLKLFGDLITYVIILFAQRYFIQGIVITGVKR
jgi:ABC-type glycerol-3-phosphate transport system permease component